MNLTKYLITFLIFVSVTIFSTAGFFIGNKNSSTVPCNFDQSSNPIIIRNLILENDNSEIKKRSVVNENIQLNSTNNLSPMLNNIKYTEYKKSGLVSLYFNSDDVDLNSEKVNEFVDNFEKEIGELASITNQENIIVKRISVQILEKHFSLLQNVRNLQNELKNYEKFFEKFCSRRRKFNEKNLDKLFLFSPEYDVKYTNEYLNQLKDNVDKYKKLLNTSRETVSCFDKIYENINRMFEIFFYSYEFDTTKFNKEELRTLFNLLKVDEFEYGFEKISIDDLFVDLNKKIRFLGIFSFFHFISPDFYSKLKEYYESGFNVANDVVKEINQYTNKWSSTKKKIKRFVEKMDVALNEDE
ncbi:hypothetical protein TUBRATIS_16490 [Tubulinosema ratisbonensis]|uniref:Uncharacterized protein n=1 Tax=Tubulinosema ratisbonensis TaxID=291195 RepID=A0A437ALD6_9MICR|nr:hypothetical protein TUBRATIS_16490 [Tubulinosema ratisbonensis]